MNQVKDWRSEGLKQYQDLLRDVLMNGTDKTDRTGTGTRSVFGRQMCFNLIEGFPLLTTKRVYWKGVVEELLWFLRGSTNSRELEQVGVNIWREWADKETGELGPVYGRQWRSWPSYNGEGIDQIARLVKGLKETPDSRRHIVSAWNVAQIGQMALPPCHCFFQFYVEKPAGFTRGRLSCQLYQRSADLFLGVPFNIASYSLLTHMIAQVCGMEAGDFIHTLGDAHIYNNHFAAVEEQLSRKPRPLPDLHLANEVNAIDAFRRDDIRLIGYRPHEAIKAPVAI